MLTKLTVRNFKRFESIEVDLDGSVLFVGPNNSGKTTAMQALALWDIGLRRWNERWSGRSASLRRPGVTVNRRELTAIPVPTAKALWRQLHVRNVQITDGKQQTENVRVEIVVAGETHGKTWECGLEFDYANEESFYCRPLRLPPGSDPTRMPVPEEAGSTRIEFLPPMSGLTANETRLDRGAVDVRIGEGRTAEVLRNLCHRLYEDHPDAWNRLIEQIRRLFGIEIDDPEYITERGEVAMTYRENDIQLDLTASGRGLQQTMLLLTFVYLNPGATILLDEPDAHLEILRQRQIYDEISEVATQSDSQLIIATHSEVLLNRAAPNDLVIAFVGKPHPLDGQRSEVVNALSEYGFEHYIQAEETGWVLYLEGATDLAVLRSFAHHIRHDGAIRALERPFVHFVGNQPEKARRHFHSVHIAVPHLRAVALFDNLGEQTPNLSPISSLMWQRNEIENYLTSRSTLMAYATDRAEAYAETVTLFDQLQPHRWIDAMDDAISKAETALKFRDVQSIADPMIKASEEVLEPLFRTYFRSLNRYNEMPKKNFHQLVQYVPDDEIDPEIIEKLDAIAAVAESVIPPGLS